MSLPSASRDHDAHWPRSLLLGAAGLAALLGACGGELEIHDVQGDAGRSPLVGQQVTVEGIVSAVLEDGMFLQGRSGDWSRATSQALFVAAVSDLRPGDRVRVRGQVTERSRNERELPVTTLAIDGAGDLEVLDRDLALPRPFRLRSLPDEAPGVVAAWEALEGMLVEIPGGQVIGPTDGHGEAVLLLDQDADRSLPRSPTGGLTLVDGAAVVPYPFRVVLDDALSPMPEMKVGDRIDQPVVGIVDYRFGTYRLLPLESPTVLPGAEEGEAWEPAAEEHDLSFATFNVENLDLGDEPSRFRRLASIVIDDLGAPDVLGLQEVQDDSGPLDDGVVSSEGAHRRLISAIAAVGGPPYLFREVRPIDNQDGGAPGGNIRVSVLVRTDRGISVVDRPGDDPARLTTVAVIDETGRAAVSPSPGRLGLGEAAFRDTRKPLVVQLELDGESLFVVVCHLSSKRGDDLPFGVVQPPQRRSEPQRVAQARLVAGFVSDLLRLDRNARIAVLGDFNDFHFSKPLGELEAAGLRNALLELPPEQRYTYVHQGVSQALDHVLLSSALLGASPPRVRIAHVNAEHPGSRRASDHDPVVVHVPRARSTDAPTTARDNRSLDPANRSTTQSPERDRSAP